MKNSKRWLQIILCIVLAVALIVGFGEILNKSDKDQQNNADTGNVVADEKNQEQDAKDSE